MRYQAHDEFVAPAKARCELWRTALGYVLINVAHVGLIAICFSLLAPLIGEDVAQSLFNDIFLAADTATHSLLLLGSYVFLIVGTLAVTVQLNRRRAISLTGAPRLAVAQFLKVLRSLMLLYVVLYVLMPGDTDLQPNLAFGRWLLLLPISIAALLVQTTAEELFFRGYLQQQLAARIPHPVVWMGLPAVIFAWGHYNASEAGPNAIYAALWAGFFALAASDLTARTGTIGAAVALHFINNASAILIVSVPGQLSGLSLYTYPFSLDSALLQPFFVVDLGLLGVSWLAARVALRV